MCKPWEGLGQLGARDFPCCMMGFLALGKADQYASWMVAQWKFYGAGLKATAVLDQLPVGRPAYLVIQVMLTGAVPVVQEWPQPLF